MASGKVKEGVEVSRERGKEGEKEAAREGCKGNGKGRRASRSGGA